MDFGTGALLGGLGGGLFSGLGSMLGASDTADALREAARKQQEMFNKQLGFQQAQLGAPSAEFPLGTPTGLAWYTRGFEPREFGYSKSLYEALKRAPEELAGSYRGIQSTLKPAEGVISDVLAGKGEAERLGWLAPIAEAREAAARTTGAAVEDALRASKNAALAQYGAQGFGQGGTTMGRRMAELEFGAAQQQSQALADAILQNRMAEAAAQEQAYLEQLGLAQAAPQLGQGLVSIENLPATAAGQEMASLWSIPMAVAAQQRQFTGPQAIDYSRFVPETSAVAEALKGIGGTLGGLGGYLTTQDLIKAIAANQTSSGPRRLSPSTDTTYGYPDTYSAPLSYYERGGV